jgi:hypothetical protein
MQTVHDPGGKNCFKMRPGTHGDARFAGASKEHRLWLLRDWSMEHLDSGAYVLWIGMNPSTADHLTDDLTVRKDQVFTERHGLSRMFKVNVSSYRSTDPAGLNARGVVISHPDNLITIRSLAEGASLIVAATGRVPDLLVPHAQNLFRAMKKDARKMVCLGLTLDGWPKHSSRLAYSTPFQDFNP